MMSESSEDIPEDLKSLNVESFKLLRDNNNLRIPFANDGNQNSWNGNMFQTVSQIFDVNLTFFILTLSNLISLKQFPLLSEKRI